MRAIRLGTMAVLALASGSTALANDPPSEAAALRALQDCRAIAEDAARLACLDRTAAELIAAVERKEVVVVSQAELKKSRRGLFGFTLPKLPFFKGDSSAEEEEPSEIRTTVTASDDLGNGEWRIVTAEGGVWRTTEAVKALPPKPGSEIILVRGALGRYFVKLGSGRRVSARRVA